jgi:hypothetical protein
MSAAGGRVIVGPRETSAGKVVLIGGTCLLALVDGGLSNLLVTSCMAGGTVVAHNAMCADDVEKDKMALIAELEEDSKLDIKDRKHDHRAREGLHRMAKGLATDHTVATWTSLGLGLVTFINPLVGLSCIGALALGRFRNRGR